MVNSEDVATTHGLDKAKVTSSLPQNMAAPLSPRSDGMVLSTTNNEKTVTTALSLIDRETNASLPLVVRNQYCHSPLGMIQSHLACHHSIKKCGLGMMLLQLTRALQQHHPGEQ